MIAGWQRMDKFKYFESRFDKVFSLLFQNKIEVRVNKFRGVELVNEKLEPAYITNIDLWMYWVNNEN